MLSCLKLPLTWSEDDDIDQLRSRTNDATVSFLPTHVFPMAAERWPFPVRAATQLARPIFATKRVDRFGAAIARHRDHTHKSAVNSASQPRLRSSCKARDFQATNAGQISRTGLCPGLLLFFFFKTSRLLLFLLQLSSFAMATTPTGKLPRWSDEHHITVYVMIESARKDKQL